MLRERDASIEQIEICTRYSSPPRARGPWHPNTFTAVRTLMESHACYQPKGCQEETKCQPEVCGSHQKNASACVPFGTVAPEFDKRLGLPRGHCLSRRPFKVCSVTSSQGNNTQLCLPKVWFYYSSTLSCFIFLALLAIDLGQVGVEPNSHTLSGSWAGGLVVNLHLQQKVVGSSG